MSDFAAAIEASPSWIICGRKRRKRSCAHCGRRTHHLCDWRMMRPRPTKVWCLQPGMRVEGYEYGRETINGRITVVRHLTKSDVWHWPPAFMEKYSLSARRYVEMAIEYAGARRHPKQGYLYEPKIDMIMVVGDTLPILRPGLCSKACCNRCRRTVAPDIDYCADHWNDQNNFLRRQKTRPV